MKSSATNKCWQNNRIAVWLLQTKKARSNRLRQNLAPSLPKDSDLASDRETTCQVLNKLRTVCFFSWPGEK